MAPKPNTKRKGKHAEPPLDNPGWVPIRGDVGVLKWLQRRFGHPLLASRHLTEAVCEGEVPVSCTNIYTGERKHVPPKYFLDICMADGALEPRFDFEKGRHWEFSVWGPKFAKRWPEWKRTAYDDGETPTAEPRKPGRKITGNWKLHVAGELHRVVVIEGKSAPTATKLADYCQRKTGYRPDESTVQKLLRTLLD